MDEDIYAYEREANEADQWEEMYAQEMELASEVMELEMTEIHETQSRISQSDFLSKSSNSVEIAHHTTSNLEKSGLIIPKQEDAISRASHRLNSVLERCAAVLGEPTNTNSLDPDCEETEILADQTLLRKPTYGLGYKRTTSIYDEKETGYLLSRPPADAGSMPVVLPNGERKYIRKRSRFFTARNTGLTPDVNDAQRTGRSSLAIDVDIASMLESIEKRQIERTMADQEQEEVKRIQHNDSTRIKNGMLWLDKYKPQRFIDLLSDERTNREVLLWMKQWETLVFPNKKPVNLPSNSNASLDVNDPRPRQKVLLIYGPPGAGKTTLANIVARHAGYNPIEVNASDDRTANTLKTKIIDAMEMQSITGDRKPNCIILDEIDGAMNGGEGKNAIAALLDIITTPLHNTDSSQNQSSSNKKNKISKQHPLIRPIICICNDQFAPVLRPLRQQAKIFQLSAPDQQKLTSRLKYISREEQLAHISTAVLANLCATGSNDIRYCVNALQFQSSTTSSHASIGFNLVGPKDIQTRSVMESIDKVFYTPPLSQSRKRVGTYMDEKLPATNTTTVVDKMEEVIGSVANTQTFLSALHENIPRMIFNDPTMNKLCATLDWIGLADHWETRSQSLQQFQFAAYLPAAVVAVHQSCCTQTRRKGAIYPTAIYECHQRKEKSNSIVSSLKENFRSSLRSLNSEAMLLEVIEPLLSILSPHIRSVNPNMHSPEEKASLTRLIEVMTDLGITYQPTVSSNGQEFYNMEPPLENLLIFRSPNEDISEIGKRAYMGYKGVEDTIIPSARRITTVSLTVRKLLMREVEIEAMRRTERMNASKLSLKKLRKEKSTISPLKNTNISNSSKTIDGERRAAQLEKERQRNPFAFAHREQKRKRELQEKQKQNASNINLNFSDEHDISNSNAENNDTSSNCKPVKKRRLCARYKFNEGYTCGIKTTVYIRDLL